MSLVTRCPKCGTRFRVTPEQLEARQGKVRCGLCLNIFDGREPLVSAPDAAAPAAVDQDRGAFRLEPVEPGAGAPEPAAPEPGLEEGDYGPAPEQLSFDDQVWIEEEHARRRRAGRGPRAPRTRGERSAPGRSARGRAERDRESTPAL